MLGDKYMLDGHSCSKHNSHNNNLKKKKRIIWVTSEQTLEGAHSKIPSHDDPFLGIQADPCNTAF